MPTNVDLVKDLPADFEIFGQAVDTQIKTNADAAINKTIVDAKGDLIVASGSDAVARLAVGTNNHVLTADSAATNGVKWAALPSSGGMTLISTTTLSSTSVTLSSIPQTYKNLQLVIRNYLPSQDDFSLYVRMNADSTASRHYSAYSFFVGNTAFDSNSWTTQGVDNGTSEGLMAIDIYDYTNTSTWKIARTSIIANHKTTPTNMNMGQINHAYNQTSAISSIEIYTDATSFSGTALLYGVS